LFSCWFDKNASCLMNYLILALALIEIGTLTPKPQEGNPKKEPF